MTNSKIEPSQIVREFNAPRQLVFDAWVNVEHLVNWMFPVQGCTCEYLSFDIKDDGSSLHKVTMPNGFEMWLLTKYEEVKAPEKLVFLQYMSNEAGEIVANERMPDWPKHMLATLHFEAVDDTRTKLTFLWEPRNPTSKELAVFEASRADHGKGWGAGMDQLARYIEAL